MNIVVKQLYFRQFKKNGWTWKWTLTQLKPQTEFLQALLNAWPVFFLKKDVSQNSSTRNSLQIERKLKVNLKLKLMYTKLKYITADKDWTRCLVEQSESVVWTKQLHSWYINRKHFAGEKPLKTKIEERQQRRLINEL